MDSEKPFDFIWNNIADLTINQNGNITEDIQKFKQYLNQDYVNYSLGSMFGAFIGDALGSYLEFAHDVSEPRVRQAMKMNGGGVFGLYPAQFTDDSQMASHMLKALCSYDSKKDFQSQQQILVKNIAIQYKQWYQSGPFDIGITTRNALHYIRQAVKNIQQQKDNKINGQPHLQNAFKQINKKNENSQSNGSLMRITPMAFFISLILKNCQNKQKNDFQNLILKQINMTHGNQIIMKASTQWVKILVDIILRKQNGYQQSLQKIYSIFIKENKDSIIKQWIEQSQKKDFMNGVSSMGWAKIAFTYGIQHMKKLIDRKPQNSKNNQSFQPNDYQEILFAVLKQAGDTDTNGAIVGGLIGAIVGFKNLPIQYLKKQFQLRLAKTEKQKLAEQKNPSNTLRDYGPYQPRLQFLRIMNLIKQFKETEQKSKSNPINMQNLKLDTTEQQQKRNNDLVSTYAFQQSKINGNSPHKIGSQQYFKGTGSHDIEQKMNQSNKKEQNNLGQQQKLTQKANKFDQVI